MFMMIVVTGGARSGKSTFAEKVARESNKAVTYLATAIAFDDGMKDRIKKHKNSRPSHWKTIEKYKGFNSLKDMDAFDGCEYILLDCMTVLVSNLLLDSRLDFDKCEMEQVDELEESIFEEINELIKVVKEHKKDIIIVTNELGMGIVPPYRMGRVFRDIAGRVNQYIASIADEVYFTVSGIPLQIK
ncbi:bifunctional adenosylcobinamide kinase/adenosylcobinamide-phosphate guanylyltransferase [Clostridiaceae bacterium M8S5]|nr:bifunctional adenosylcobinamide kinase/adenosylcobinamide-phosphate guanylyltransferase [Clostridiaceae bacterium M8S5]